MQGTRDTTLNVVGSLLPHPNWEIESDSWKDKTIDWLIDTGQSGCSAECLKDPGEGSGAGGLGESCSVGNRVWNTQGVSSNYLVTERTNLGFERVGINQKDFRL